MKTSMDSKPNKISTATPWLSLWASNDAIFVPKAAPSVWRLEIELIRFHL